MTAQEPFRKLMDNEQSVKITAKTISEALQVLCRKFPIMAQRLVDKQGQVRPFINIYLNQEEIRFLSRETALRDGDEISIIPAISGG